MFSIYGQAGRVFSGSLEQLRQIKQVARVGRVPALRDAERESVPERTVQALLADAGGAEAPLAQSGAGGVPAPAAWPQHSASRASLQAYARTGQSARQVLHRVAELMSSPALTLTGDVPARQAWAVLAEHGLGQAPVLDAQGRLVGVLLRAELAPGPDVDPNPHWQQTVVQLMRSPVPAVAPDTDVRRLAQVLLDTGLPGLPVVDDGGAVLGFVSRSDVLRALTHEPPLDLWA